MLNLNWWTHVGSCFKASRASTSGQCRYRFPRTRAASTSCTSAGVELARRVPFEYVNGCNVCMMLAFKSNHDVQVLIGSLEALLRIYYTTKYVTKRQNLVDSVTAVALGAFKRRELREQQNQSSQADRSVVGRRRVASMVFALTNRREIVGPLAALYLLRGSCAYMSATCTTLPLYDVMRQLIQHDTHSCNLVEVREGGSNITFRAASFFDNYLFRPVSLDHKCLYEFVMTCFRRKQSESTATSDLFLTGHPLYSTHCIGHHQTEAVPVITGVRMPYIDSETPPELVAKRAQCALVLFKPFRSVLDLVSDPASETAWSDAYFQWESTRTSFVCEIMANMDDYYRASKRAQEDEESGSNELDDEADSDEILGTRNNVDGAIGNMPCDSEAPTGSGRTDDFCHVFAADDDDTITGDGSTLPIFPTAKTGSLLSSFVHQELLGTTAEHVGELQEWVKNSATDEAKASLSNSSRNERPADVIDLIQRALETDREWAQSTQQHGRSPPPSLCPYPSISDVSTAFTLNQRQHVAFSLITTALLRRFQQQERANAHDSADYRASDFESRLRDDQLIMFLGGAGGTGKSRVIDAVNAFCSGWHCSNTMVKAALTGKAATLIGGRTLASFLVRLEHAIKEKKFTPLDLLIIDEISMMTKAEWLKLDKLLRRYMQIENVPFGGIHIVLVGDFLQMPPVKSETIYLDPIDKAKPCTVDLGGFELWRNIATVVILDESVSFRNDPEWGKGCRNARLGRWTPEFIDMINARVVQCTHGCDNSPPLQEQTESSAVFVTPENVTRLAINNAFMKQTAGMLPDGVYPIRVVANFKGVLNGLSRSDLTYVLGLPDNSDAECGHRQGSTLGTLEYVHLPADTDFRLVRDGAASTIVQLPSQPSDYALIRVPRPQASPIRPGLDHELFPVFYATQAYTTTTIMLSPAPEGQPRYVKLRPQQLPFVCAVGSTVYKVQGETLQSMIVMDWKSKHALVDKPQQTYLLVSRITTRNGLTALAPMTSTLVEWSKPPAHALREEERLNDLSNATLARFHLPVPANVTNQSLDESSPQSRKGAP